jgi:hypothetical protein
MKSSSKVRANMSATGSYTSIAGSLNGVDDGIKHVIKMGFITGIADVDADPMQLETRFMSDHVLIDFKSLVASDLDVATIIEDCDFVKEIAGKNPTKLKQLLEAYTDSPTGFEKAHAIAQDLGLTEEAAIKARGGVAWLAALLIVAIMSKACVDAGNGNPQGKPNPDLK